MSNDFGESQLKDVNYVGAIDIGTNSTHLLIASVDTILKTYTIQHTEKSTTRLGEKNVFTGELTNIAIDRALETLKRFKELADSYKVKNLLIAATSAVREAPNSSYFLDLIKDQIDLDVEIISGREEARLIYLGVLSGMKLEDKPHVLIDIGGGSTELILADGYDAKALTSTKIGAVRLKREFINKQPISIRKREFLNAFIQGSLESAVDKISRRIRACENPVMVATSGTALAIGNLILNDQSNLKRKLHGLKISKELVDQQVEKLLKMSPSEIKRFTPLSERRSEIILPGILILQTTMQMMKINEVLLSERALREGLVIDWMFRKGYLQDRFTLQGNIREKTVLHQAKRFGVNFFRAEKVAQYALTLYDNTYGVLHSDNGEGRELLWAAAMLHACGQHINLAAYHKHSWYLIRHGELLGYSQAEHLMVASIARYHRKGFPKKRHEAWQSLMESYQRDIVFQMSILLRLASALDRRPEPIISHLEVKVDNSKLKIKLVPEKTNRNFAIEEWSLRKTFEIIGEHLEVDWEMQINY